MGVWQVDSQDSIFAKRPLAALGASLTRWQPRPGEQPNEKTPRGGDGKEHERLQAAILEKRPLAAFGASRTMWHPMPGEQPNAKALLSWQGMELHWSKLEKIPSDMLGGDSSTKLQVFSSQAKLKRDPVVSSGRMQSTAQAL
jgi:hypothetical protein